MEFVGVVGSILQVAQVGAQLSLNLYKIAQSVGSANRDVQYVAKDIALFSTVLKDLGNTLSKGQKSDLYREDAYQAGLDIAKECEGVFQEIQDILNKFNKNGGGTSASIRRIDRLGIFRKSRVQLLRGTLEFLKSKILLQVAVLSYAEKVSASSNSTADIDGLLALKSLVLANETTKAAFGELFTKSTEGSSQGNPISISEDTRSRAPTLSATSGSQSSATAAPTFLSIAEILHKSEPAFPPPPSRRRTYAKVWGTVDRLELALRKVETAEWELERLRTILASNVKVETSTRDDWTEREKTCLSKLKISLTRFGLKKEKINQAIASVMTHQPGTSMRTEVEQVVSQNDVLFATLHHFGASWENDKNNPDSRVFKRWIPDYLEDILREKIYETFETATDRPPGSNINTSDSASMSDSEEQSVSQKHQAIRQAIDHVNQSIMAIERLDDPKNVHDVQPEARQLEPRHRHLTVPAPVVIPKKASLAMGPPQKPSSISFSTLGRSTFDATLEAGQKDADTDRPRKVRERPSTSMVSTRAPSLNIIGEEDYPGRSDYRLTDSTQRSLDDLSPRRYAGLRSSSNRDDISASSRTHGTKDRHQYDSPTRPSPFLLPSPSLKRKTPATPSTTSQNPDSPLPQPAPLQEPRQWFELEKHDKTSQTVRALLKKWTYLDLGDDDDGESGDEQHRGPDDDEDGARVAGARKDAGAAVEKRLGSRGDSDGGGGGDGRERAGDGRGKRTKKPRIS